MIFACRWCEEGGSLGVGAGVPSAGELPRLAGIRREPRRDRTAAARGSHGAGEGLRIAEFGFWVMLRGL